MATGRTDAEMDAFTAYFKAQGLFGIPRAGEVDYTQVVSLDLTTITPSVAGPKRPQDRIALSSLKAKFSELFSKPVGENGFAKNAADLAKRVVTARVPDGVGAISDASMKVPGNGQRRDLNVHERNVAIGNGDVLIAAITSCTNTSNPGVLLAAGLLARKAVERGLTVKRHIKTSLAPGSRVVTDYLTKAGLLPYLEQLGFGVAAYGCTTCIGNAGDLAPEFNDAIVSNDLICAAVLSGNRNFEARIHPNLKANFLASPPLVVAYAIAGTVLRDLTTEPLGMGKDGKPVFLKDVWPTSHEIAAVLPFAREPATFRKLYGSLATANPLWGTISGATGQVYGWPTSTYIARPPFFDGFTMTPAPTTDIKGARVLGLFGDSITTDHISPAGAIKADSPAGKWLLANNVGEGRLQQLRLAPRQPRDHDARHVRQRAHQEPDAAAARGRYARGRWRHAVPAR